MDRSPDKRLTQRLETDMEIEWLVPRRRVLRTVEVAEPARVVNVSSTGIRFLARPVSDVTVGRRVGIRCNGIDGEVLLRRVVLPAAQEGDAGEQLGDYAGELVTPDRELLEALLGTTEAAPRVDLEVLWNRGI